MRFRQLVLCMIVGFLLCAFPSINTYATEEVTVNTDQVEENEVKTTEAAKVIMVASSIDKPETEETVLEEKQTEETSKVAEETSKTTEETSRAKDETTKVTEKTSKTKADNENNKEKSNADEKSKAIKESQKAEDSHKKAESKAQEKKAEKKKKYSGSDLRLLSSIIYCEAGCESYKGKVAVGIVVMNRVKSNLFPDTVKGVIYQSYQFTPARNGSLDRALDQYDKGQFTSESEKECIEAAKEVLSGKSTITINGKEKDFSKYLFFSGNLKGHTFKLGNHEFK